MPAKNDICNMSLKMVQLDNPECRKHEVENSHRSQGGHVLFYFCWKILLANNEDPDQMPHYVASDLGLHCLPMTLQVSR